MHCWKLLNKKVMETWLQSESGSREECGYYEYKVWFTAELLRTKLWKLVQRIKYNCVCINEIERKLKT